MENLPPFKGYQEFIAERVQWEDWVAWAQTPEKVLNLPVLYIMPRPLPKRRLISILVP